MSPIHVTGIDHVATPFTEGSASLPLILNQPKYSERRRTVRHLGHLEQRQALEVLSHAVEYLIDARLGGMSAQVVKDNHEAVQILMRLSRVIFSECPDTPPASQRVTRWLMNMVGTISHRVSH